MRDGKQLIADLYQPSTDATAPVVLTRTPYGRGSVFSLLASMLAERGNRVLLQSVRGTSGSEGMLDPMRQEAADGQDTVQWIRSQPWFSGRLYTFGGSYLGNVQWALAAADPAAIDGAAMSVTLSNFRDELLGFGAQTLNGTLTWTAIMQLQLSGAPKVSRRKLLRKVHKALPTLPVGAMDEVAVGRKVSWWQDWTTHADPDDPWWRAMDYSAAPARLGAPVSMVAGWHDIFLPFQLRDFVARQTAGLPTWLTIGPWSHASPGGMLTGAKDAAEFFSALRRNEAPHARRGRVRLYLQEAEEWREYPVWPPPEAKPMELYLHPERSLTRTPSAVAGAFAGYAYDPADPTPSLHGAVLMGGSRVRDMSALEDRDDTVSFTGPELGQDLDAIGPVTAELSVQSDREHTDFFVCLCDVDRKARPRQVCDGFLRLRPGKSPLDERGTRHILLECWPTAYRFRKGHRLRLIVASGAFPRFARNLGTGEPHATATAMVRANQKIMLGKDAPSLIRISVMPLG